MSADKSDKTKIKVMWHLGKGFWDMALFAELFQNKLWPTPVEFSEQMGLDSDADEGAAIVLPARWVRDEDECGGINYLRDRISKLPWYVLIHLGDEESIFDSSEFKTSRSKLWIQTQYPHRMRPSDRNILFTWPNDTRQILKDFPQAPVKDRILWSFAGQVTHAFRDSCVEQLRKRPDGEGKLHETAGFAQGLDRPDYLKLLSQTAIAPCPSGPCTPETFRLYEALEAGCLPVTDRRAPDWPRDTNYWQSMIGYEPFPTVDSWKHIHSLLDHYKANPLELQKDTNKATAWWIGYKRSLVMDLMDDIAQVSGKDIPSGQITVIMPTSPILSHPSTKIIEDSIRFIRSYPELKDAEILILCDGVRSEQAHYAEPYEEYKRRLIHLCNNHPDFYGCLPLVFSSHTHQANMIREALKLARTPLIMFCEHDCWPTGEISFESIFSAFGNSGISYIRFSIFDHILAEHEYLYPDLAIEDMGGAPLIKTIQYSARPHVARTEWYRALIDEFFKPTACTMIEDRLHGAVIDGSAAGRDFGMWQYTPRTGSILRSATSDGRKTDIKYDMSW